MDEIKKLFKKITKKDRLMIEAALLALFKGELAGLKIQKLKGYEHIYRLRVGNYRIIYYQDSEGIILKAIKRRNESTYSDF